MRWSEVANMGCRAVHSWSEAYTFLSNATSTGALSSRFRNWFYGRNLSSPLPLGPYRRLLEKMISLSIPVTKLNLRLTDRRSSQAWCSMAWAWMIWHSLLVQRWKGLNLYLVLWFTTCLAIEMESLLFLESPSSAAGDYRFAHGACVFGCTLHSEDSASCRTSMQLFLARLAFISVSSISQVVSRKSCRCFRLVYISSHRWISLLPSIDCFLLNKTSSSSVLFLITMSLSTSPSRKGCFLGGPDFWGLLAAFHCLAYLASLRPAWGGLSRQGWPGLVLKCGSIFVTCVCMLVHLAKLSKIHIDITCVSQPFPNIAPSPTQLF